MKKLKALSLAALTLGCISMVGQLPLSAVGLNGQALKRRRDASYDMVDVPVSSVVNCVMKMFHTLVDLSEKGACLNPFVRPGIREDRLMESAGIDWDAFTNERDEYNIVRIWDSSEEEKQAMEPVFGKRRINFINGCGNFASSFCELFNKLDWNSKKIASMGILTRTGLKDIEGRTAEETYALQCRFLGIVYTHMEEASAEIYSGDMESRLESPEDGDITVDFYVTLRNLDEDSEKFMSELPSYQDSLEKEGVGFLTVRF